MGRVYVNRQLGNNSNPGTEFLPLMSIGAALSSPANSEIFVFDGIYDEILDATSFDGVRRKLVGLGDVYLDARTNSSIFSGSLINNHLFKNIKFVNYSKQALSFSGGTHTFSGCFFKPSTSTATRAFFITGPKLVTPVSIELRKCTVLNNEAIFSISLEFNTNALIIPSITNSLFYGHSFQILGGSSTDSFTTFLTAAQDKGNYYDNNIHVANGGMNSLTGENPPLWVNPSGGNYDLQPTSTLVGGGYQGSDIGSFHEFCPLTSILNEPVSIFDFGWQNDNSYYNIGARAAGPDGPANAAGIIQTLIDGNPRWIIDLANTPTGKSGRLFSPVFDLKMERKITRAGWSSEEDLTPVSGSRKKLSNSNLAIPDLEIRGSINAFLETDATPTWSTFTRATSINLQARFVQMRITFRLDGV